MSELTELSDEDLAGRMAALMNVVAGLTSSDRETRQEWAELVEGMGHNPGYHQNALDTLYRERIRRQDYPAWTPFVPAIVDPAQFYTPEAQERFRILGEKAGKTMEEMQAVYLTTLDDEIYLNSRYQVAIRRTPTDDGEGGIIEMVHISVKRLDQRTIHDWRDMQRIKNELLGPNCEAVELYPAVERVVDTANQYHMWGVNSGTYRWPIGWDQGSLAMGDGEAPGVGQREFEA